jgi:hypothetical protein
MYNAMTYSDVKNFGLTLFRHLQERFTKDESKMKRLSRGDVDDEELGYNIAKTLASVGNQDIHKVIVIDEVDQFSSNEKAFTFLIKALLRGTKKCSMTNTSIMGIANSVDLPFKKKHSAIAMRDCTLLFSPYDTE